MNENGMEIKRRPSSSGRGSGPGAKKGRKRTVGTSGEPTAKVTLTLPVEFIKDIKQIAAEERSSASAIVYRHCSGPVRKDMARLAEKQLTRSRR